MDVRRPGTLWAVIVLMIAAVVLAIAIAAYGPSSSPVPIEQGGVVAEQAERRDVWDTGWLWSLATIMGVAVLGAAIAYGIRKTQHHRR